MTSRPYRLDYRDVEGISRYFATYKTKAAALTALRDREALTFGARVFDTRTGQTLGAFSNRRQSRDYTRCLAVAHFLRMVEAA
jgi:hypothetical protein